MINRTSKLLGLGLCIIMTVSMMGCTIEVDDLNSQLRNNLDKVKDKVTEIAEFGEDLAFADQYDRVEGFSEVFSSDILSLSIDNKVGVVKIYEGTSSDLTVNYEKKVKSRNAFEAEINKAMESITVAIKENNNKLEIAVSMTKDLENIFRNRAVAFEIFIPSGVKEVYIENSVGAAELVGLDVDYIKSNISVGEIKISNSSAKEVNINTSTGSIKLDNTQLVGRAKTSTGSIEIYGGKLTGDTILESSTGSIKVSAGLAEGSSYNFSSKTGSIQVDLQEDYAFKLDAKTSIGSIETNLQLKDVYSQKGILTGTIGDGGGKITLRTEVGSVTINKK